MEHLLYVQCDVKNTGEILEPSEKARKRREYIWCLNELKNWVLAQRTQFVELFFDPLHTVKLSTLHIGSDLKLNN